MKYVSYIIIFIAILAGCHKAFEVTEPSFEVSTNTLTVKVGDSVIFYLEGNPDIITFYSGEIGNDYAYVDQDRILPTDSVLVSFQSQVRSQSGTSATYCQDSQFHVCVSKDLVFSGTTASDSAQSVQNATWEDISDRFTLCTLECSSTTAYASSGTANIVDLFETEVPLYFAFRYINKPNAEYGNANIWRFSSFTMASVTDSSGSATMTDQANAGWVPVFIGDGWDATRFTNTGSIITMRGYTTNTIDQELWCIANPVEITDTNLGHEYGIGIKSVGDAPLTSYGHQFNEAGVYTVTFVAANSSVYGRKEVVRQLQITVTE
ncbi:MAG: DUF5017 domain-containing protein [Niabella sp.]